MAYVSNRHERTINMKQSKLIFLLCALAFAGIAVSSINCMFPGTMDGSVGVNISDQPVWGPEGYDRLITITFPI